MRHFSFEDWMVFSHIKFFYRPFKRTLVTYNGLRNANRSRVVIAASNIVLRWCLHMTATVTHVYWSSSSRPSRLRTNSTTSISAVSSRCSGVTITSSLSVRHDRQLPRPTVVNQHAYFGIMMPQLPTTSTVTLHSSPRLQQLQYRLQQRQRSDDEHSALANLRSN